MSLDFQIGTRARRAKQNEPFCAVFGKILDRITGIEVPGLQQTPCASQAASLMTDRGQLDSGGMGCVPDVLIFTY